MSLFRALTGPDASGLNFRAQMCDLQAQIWHLSGYLLQPRSPCLGALAGEIEPVNRSRFGRADHPFTFLGAGIFNIANGARLLAPADFVDQLRHPRRAGHLGPDSTRRRREPRRKIMSIAGVHIKRTERPEP
jgi:hypothetical protein